MIHRLNNIQKTISNGCGIAFKKLYLKENDSQVFLLNTPKPLLLWIAFKTPIVILKRDDHRLRHIEWYSIAVRCELLFQRLYLKRWYHTLKKLFPTKWVIQCELLSKLSVLREWFTGLEGFLKNHSTVKLWRLLSKLYLKRWFTGGSSAVNLLG